MVIAIFDASALVKRYRTVEVGSEKVNKIFEDKIYSNLIISLTIVEMLNVFYRLKRDKLITTSELNEIINTFYNDIAMNKIKVYSIRDKHIYYSEKIISKIHELKPVVKKRPGPFDAILITCCKDFAQDKLILVPKFFTKFR